MAWHKHSASKWKSGEIFINLTKPGLNSAEQMVNSVEDHSIHNNRNHVTQGG